MLIATLVASTFSCTYLTRSRASCPARHPCPRRTPAEPATVALNAYHGPHPPSGASPGFEEFLSGLGGGGGVALSGARVTGVRVTPISGMSDWDGADRRGAVYTRVGAGAVICSAEGGGGGGSGAGGGAIAVDRAGAGLEGAG